MLDESIIIVFVILHKKQIKFSVIFCKTDITSTRVIFYLSYHHDFLRWKTEICNFTMNEKSKWHHGIFSWDIYTLWYHGKILPFMNPWRMLEKSIHVLHNNRTKKNRGIVFSFTFQLKLQQSEKENYKNKISNLVVCRRFWIAKIFCLNRSFCTTFPITCNVTFFNWWDSSNNLCHSYTSNNFSILYLLIIKWMYRIFVMIWIRSINCINKHDR